MEESRLQEEISKLIQEFERKEHREVEEIKVGRELGYAYVVIKVSKQ